MDTDQKERMSSTVSHNRELRLLRAQEQIAAELRGIHETLAMFFYKMYEENCLEQIEEHGNVGVPAEVRLKDRPS